MKVLTQPLDRATAAEFASWFKALADPTRVQIVSLLARRGMPMNVGDDRRGRRGRPVHRVGAPEDSGRGPVILADPRGTSTYYRINEACVSCFPTAADLVMGKLAPLPPGDATPGKEHAMASGADRDVIIDRYSELARAALGGEEIRDCDGNQSQEGCVGPAAYSGQDDAPEAALRVSLGCGNPLAVAAIQPWETVLDLGSGGGLDVPLSARRTGPAGLAYGLDASPDMLALARANAAQAGVTNARFLHGRIEDIPPPDERVDVIISNRVVTCPLTRHGRDGGVPGAATGRRIGISDVIADEGADQTRRADDEQQVGCAARTVTQLKYRELLRAAGFIDVSITATMPAGSSLHFGDDPGGRVSPLDIPRL